MGNAISLLAAVHRKAGEKDVARQVQEEAIALRERLQHPWSEAVARINLVHLDIEAGKAQETLPHLVRVFTLLRQIDSEQIGVYLLDVTAVWCAVVGRHESAVLLEVAARTQYQRVGMYARSDEADVMRFEHSRSQLDPVACEQAQRIGAGLTYREALRQVQDVLLSPMTSVEKGR